MKTIEQNRLEQVRLLHTLASDFSRFYKMFGNVRSIFVDYREIPKKMTKVESDIVLNSLCDCYQGVRFLYRTALLVDKGILDIELLYIFYFDEITDYLTDMLNTLIKWCGTSFDSAANYNSNEVARISTALIDLAEKLYIVHKEHGADLDIEGSSYIEDFKANIKDFFSNPGKFNMCSPDYEDNWVEISGWDTYIGELAKKVEKERELK